MQITPTPLVDAQPPLCILSGMMELRLGLLALALIFTISSASTSHTSTEIDYTVRRKVNGWIDGGPCKMENTKCWNKKMLKYVNDFRKKNGVPAMKIGTKKMFKLAQKHSEAMEARGKPYHQVLSAVKLKCNSWFSAENVANNHCRKSKKPTNPARMCVDQFIGSKSHRKNLLGKNYESIVMGIVISNDGYFWCTQIFAQFTEYKASGPCKPYFGGGGGGIGALEPDDDDDQDDQDDSNDNSSTLTEHRFELTSFSAKLKCRDGSCRYCLDVAGAELCLTPELSVVVDTWIAQRFMK